MNRYMTRAVASAAFAGLFNLPAQAGPAEEIEATLASVKAKAVSAFFQGEHSKNFNHLKSSPANSSKPALRPPVEVRNFSIYYRQELTALKDVCPALKDVNPKEFNALKWFQKNVPEQDLSDYRRDFIEAAYYTIGYQPKSPEKTEAIVKLNFALADSTAFVEFLEKKQEQVRKALETDTYLANAEKSWPTSTKATRQRAIEYASRLTLNILLKGSDIEHPKTFLLNDDIMEEYSGFYHPNYNETYYNDDVMVEDFTDAMNTVVHETYHAFQGILANWQSEGLLKKHVQLDRQGKLYYMSAVSGGTAIPASENRLGYRFGVDERGAWGFAAGAAKKSARSLTQDMFTEFKEEEYRLYQPPVYKQDAEEGRLPAACLG